MATLTTLRNESATGQSGTQADRGLTLLAMGGAVCGAITGVFVGAEAGTAYPVLFGGAGTMLGSGLVAALWGMFTDREENRVPNDAR